MDILVSEHEFNRLKEVERAWEALFSIVQARGDSVFQRPLTGKACAVLELNRLYNLETFHKAREEGLVK
jgi:hypothetical protein